MVTNAQAVDHNYSEAKEYLEKIHALKYLLSRDLLACDAKWTLFVAAALSYRFESQVKPFPPKFLSETTGYNIEALTAVINDTPKLKILLRNICEENYDELDTEVVDLLYWVLVEVYDPMLRSSDTSEYVNVMSKVPQKHNAAQPSHIFIVSPPVNSNSEEIFEQQKGSFPSKYAFHGSKLDSFYSIINHGLHQHLCKKGMFGEGVYLSSELSVSMDYSPYGAGWGASNCGAMISCIAMCEYIENPEFVKFEQTVNTKSNMPNTYILISNNDVVRVRYLLFYGKKFPEDKSTTDSVLNWMSSHRYMLSLLCYTLFLTVIGVVNSGNGSYMKYIISKKASEVMTVIRKLMLGNET